MSVTIIGIFGMLVSPLLLKWGFSEACSNQIIQFAPTAFFGFVAWWGRYRQGDIKWFGKKIA